MPKTNVSEKDADINKLGENIEVSRNTLGRAIGLPNLILEYFYNKNLSLMVKELDHKVSLHKLLYGI